MTLMIKISSVARRGFSLKARTFSKVYRLPLKSVLPNTPVICKTLGRNKDVIRTEVCQFHVSSQRNALPPLLVLVLRVVAKAGTVVSGKLIRMWWQKLTPEEKWKVLTQIRSKKDKIAFVGCVFAGFGFLYYLEHIIEDPITKRRKFIMLNQEQVVQIAEFEYQHQLQKFKSEIVPKSHPICRRVERVVNNLLLSNSDLKEIKDKVWAVTVIDRPDIANAFALPHGKIFVFTGMLNVCTNDDQLAVVLAHEISHSILCHVAESMSKVFLVEFILLIPSLIIWIIFPNMWAIFSEWVVSNLAKVLIHLPFSRSIEKEADVVGMQLAAKSCYDVREAPSFWRKMKNLNTDFPVEWLSTHPSHQKRQMELQELVPEALLLRDKSKCPPLGVRIPQNLWQL